MTRSPFEPIRIGISLGNTGNFQGGLGEFSMQLCSRLAARASELRDRHRIILYFHLKQEFVGAFGDDVSYLPTTRWQRWYHHQPEPFALWHQLNQLNHYRPPVKTAQRLATVHDLNFAYFKNGFSRWRDGRRLQCLLNRCDHLIAISDYVRQDIHQRTNWSRPIHVIYNGARNLSLSPKEAVAPLVQRQFLFHLSRMSASKNISSLLNLAAFWPEKTFVLAGPAGASHRATRDEVIRRGLSNVVMLENISDAQKAWLYENCQAFLFPSLTEGFGLPPIEAMHFGKPVFLSTRTCLPEIGGAAARYWHSFDPISMRQVVESSMQSWTTQNAEQAREQADRYQWDRCAQEYLQTYLSHAALVP
jgi:glycosyltransferase involved in cell wall biosynthesis